jgi:hypothetical protein
MEFDDVAEPPVGNEEDLIHSPSNIFDDEGTSQFEGELPDGRGLLSYVLDEFSFSDGAPKHDREMRFDQPIVHVVFCTCLLNPVVILLRNRRIGNNRTSYVQPSPLL